MSYCKIFLLLGIILCLSDCDAQDPCPDPEAILPCTCYQQLASLHLDCTQVESEEQLSQVFQQNFPVKDFFKFEMTTNSRILTLDVPTNGVSFEYVDLFPGPFSLEAVGENFFLDSVDTLTDIRIHDTNLTTEGFIFSSMAAFPNLDMVDLSQSRLSYLPDLQNDNLRVFGAGFTDISTLNPGKRLFEFQFSLLFINFYKLIIQHFWKEQ